MFAIKELPEFFVIFYKVVTIHLLKVPIVRAPAGTGSRQELNLLTYLIERMNRTTPVGAPTGVFLC